ncbi:MAG: SDR family oxidoreductase [Psychroserpens sp.]|nr:SDR family oxidoreductase [Psychroserpens sp.]
MDQKICIIGCGWLGLPLAKSLIKKGFQIKGSTRATSKLELLRKEGIDPYLITVFPDEIIGNLDDCLKDCHTLVLNIPPGFRKNPNLDLKTQMEHFIPGLENSSIHNLLYISSTSVYEDAVPFQLIKEDARTSSSERAIKLVAAEDLFFKNPNFQTTVLRFSGLFGNDRHPAKFLSGRSEIKNPEAPVNLIHLNDCIGIIESVLEQSAWNLLFNASNPSHPTRKDYYTRVCKTMGLPLPLFDHSQKSKGKIIDSSKMVQKLNYRFEDNL